MFSETSENIVFTILISIFSYNIWQFCKFLENVSKIDLIKQYNLEKENLDHKLHGSQFRGEALGPQPITRQNI